MPEKERGKKADGSSNNDGDSKRRADTEVGKAMPGQSDNPDIQNKFRQFYERSRDGMVIVDIDGRFLDANPAYCRMVGYTLEELRGLPNFYEITPEKWWEWERTEIWEKQLLGRGYTDCYEKEYIRKDGSVVPVELQSYMVKDTDGSPSYLWGVARDISDRKSSQSAFRRSEEQIRLMYETMPIGVVYQDTDGQIVSANPAAREILGLTTDELLSRTSEHPEWRSVYLDGTPRPAEDHPAMICLRTGKPCYDIMGIYNPEKDSTLWLDIQAIPLFQGDETSPWRVYATFRDITEKVESERQIQRMLSTIEQAESLIRMGFYERNWQTGKGFWSDGFCRLLGLEPGTILKHEDFEQFIHPEDRKRVQAHVFDSIRRHSSMDVEFRLVTAQNEEIIIRGVGQTLYDHDAKPLLTRGVFQDITRSQHTVNDLRDQVETFRATISASSDGFCLVDLDGRILEVNQSYSRMSGYSVDQLLDMNLSDLEVMENPEEIRRHILKLMQIGSEVFETRHRRKDGTSFQVEVSTTYNRQTGRVSTFIRDITDRKRTEELIRESEQQVRARLDEILHTGSDISDLPLGAVLDTPAIQSVMDEFYRLTGIGVAILDIDGKVLVATGWQDVCTRFHRVHPETRKNCLESDTRITKDLQDGEIRIYKCKNNMWDIATPIFINGQRMGNTFLGQFFFADEVPDLSVFEEQAERYGFDREAYLEVVSRIPRFTRQQIDSVMRYYMRFTQLIAELSFSNIKLARTDRERENLLERIRENEEHYRRLVEGLPDIVYVFSRKKGASFWSRRVQDILGITPDDLQENPFRWFEMIHEEDRQRVNDLLQELNPEKNFDFVYRIHDVNGKLHWFHDRSFNVTIDGDDCIVEGIATDITAQHLAEQKLSETVENLRMAQDLANMGNWVLDPEKDRPVWSPKLFDFYEIDPADGEPTFERMRSFFTGEDLPVLERMYTEGVLYGKPFDEEFRLHFPVGRVKWIHAIGRPDPEPGPKGYVIRGTSQDITSWKQAEDALRESEEKYRLIFENAPLGIFRSLPEGRFIEVNPALAELLGYDSTRQVLEEIHDIASQVYVRGEEREPIVETQLKSDQMSIYLNEYRRRDGSTFFANLYLKTVRDSQGNPMYFEGIVEDITERLQNEKKMRQSEERLRRSLNAVSDGIWDMDLQTGEATMNDRSMVMFGFDPDDVTPHSETIFSRVFPDDLKRIHESIRRHIEGKAESYRCEFRVGRPDGSTIWVLGRGRIIDYDDQGRPKRMIGTNTDITHRKNAEQEQMQLQEQLAQAQKMESVGRLAGGVAHDFNNMLLVILGHAELALEAISKENPLRNDLEEIRNAAQRSADLTRHLLAFARKQTVTPRVLDLNATVDSMLKMLRRLIGENIELQWKPGINLSPVRIDPAQVDQILANLSVNARDAIGGIGTLTICTENVRIDDESCKDCPDAEPGDYVRLTVTDTGQGMPQETLDHIFEPFFTTKGVGEGTGLGLATVYGCVRQNNGFIQVRSREGEGTSFDIFFPKYQGEKEIKVTKSVPEKGHTGAGTILLVEDEPAILKMGQTMLNKLGYTVLSARSPGEAIEIASGYQQHIDVLLTDVVMPEMNGKELSKVLRKRFPKMKRVFMSGYSEDTISSKNLLEKGTFYIQKPFSIKALAAILKEAMRD